MHQTLIHTDKTRLTQLELARLKYVFICLLSEGSKFIIMYTIFYLLQLKTEYCIAVFVLLSVRNFSGGIHLKHYISCLLFTFSFFSGVIYCSKILLIPEMIQCILLFCTALALFIIGPITSDNRPELTQKQMRIYKSIGSFVLIIYALIFLCMKTFPYQNLIFWVIVFQILQLAAAKTIKERRNS